ncbi:MAG TPA: class I SAM-dependent methyltransferase, partial [Ktedonobacteraceae bacterium]|nr:class I SAM-dependent methyltransferase [Ktedonobacteraceae bacterium]
AGRGDLAPEIRSWAAQHAPDFSAALDYRTTDIRTGQDAITRDTDQAQQSDTPLASPFSSLRPSVVLSNELVDAFPVHIVEKRASQLYEVYVTLHEGRLYETLDEPSGPQVASYLDTYKIPWHSFDDGWRAEINLDALQWMEQASGLLQEPSSQRKRRGFILTIDYGDKARALYTRKRPHGTLACYYQHQLTERPLARPGEQDITAHVNFTALINAARQHGLRLHTFTTQRQWLTDLGIYEELEHLRTHEFAIIDTARATNQGQTALVQWYNLRQRVFSLTDSAGMGNFKVLILKR